MPLACPNCGSRFLRESRPQDFAEKLARFWFVSPLRCRDCKTRFVARTVVLADLMFARCPKCYRMDLNQWTGKSYEPPFWVGVKVNFGANRWRCEYCRINFASFRKRREVFSFGRWKAMNAAQARAQGRAKAAQLEAEAREAEMNATRAAVEKALRQAAEESTSDGSDASVRPSA